MAVQLTHEEIGKALRIRLDEIRRTLPSRMQVKARAEAHMQASRLRDVVRANERGKGCVVSADGTRIECY